MRREEARMYDEQPNVKILEIIDQVERVIIGKRAIIEKAIVALLSGGHLLLEDVPGVGKTMLIRALSRAMGLTFKRIQFTPDLLPSDVTGVSIYNQKSMEFQFRPGPIMANVVLADEINRTSPKTQAALLEAMEEGNMTVDGETYRLPEPFFVLATQNPIEYEGTFPLPEAQLDRFLLKLKMGYPNQAEEAEMLRRVQEHHPIEDVHMVLDREELLRLQKMTKKVHLEESLRAYIVELVQRTREHPAVYLGASPRGSIALMRTAQALAFIRGRDYVIPDDIREMLQPTLAHRILLKSESRLGGISVEGVLNDLLNRVRVPVFGNRI